MAAANAVALPDNLRAYAPAGSPASVMPVSNPEYLYDLAERMHAIEMLSAAVGSLGLFEQLQEQPDELAGICRRLGLSPRPTLVLLTMLWSQGLLNCDSSGVYSLTKTAREFLLLDSPWSLSACFAALKDRPSCQAILAVLRSGQPMGWQNGAESPEEAMDGTPGSGAPDWDAGMQDEAFAEFFLQAIDSRNAYLASVAAAKLDLTACRSLLDVGGGSGIYSCAFASANPALRVTVLEQPPVDGVARRAIARRGLESRVSVLSSDMRSEPLPGDHDVHLYSNVIHDWEEDTILQLLRSSFASLDEGGRVVIHDTILGAEADPRPVAEYSALLVSFTSGRCYALHEVRDLLHQAGFVNVTFTLTAVHRSLVIASKPPAPSGKEISRERESGK